MRLLTWKPELPDFRDFKYKAPRAKTLKLPKSVDLTPFCPSVRDQLSSGSCTGFGMRGIFGFMAAKQGQNFEPSPLFAYYNARRLEKTTKWDEGATIRGVIKAAAKYGICAEAYWPFRIGKVTVAPTATADKEGLKHQVLRYERINNTDINQLKALLADKIPFVFGFSCYGSMFTAEVERTGVVPVPAQGDSLEGGHAIWAVGYDDKTKLVKFQNSWGLKWGDRGYGYLPYSYITDTDLADDFWKVTLVE